MAVTDLPDSTGTLPIVSPLPLPSTAAHVTGHPPTTYEGGRANPHLRHANRAFRRCTHAGLKPS